jgi:two-component system phosphate regulon sensor histidine kinase PhoR
MPIRHFLISLAVMSLVVVSTFVTLVTAGDLGILPAAASTGLILLVNALLLHALLRGIGRLKHGVEEILENIDEAAPLVATSNLVISDIWQSILRLARLWRQRVKQVESELASSNNVLAALPDPIILVNERREVTWVNAAAGELFGDNLLGRDLAVALRNPAVLNTTDAVLKSGAGRVIEFELSMPVDRHMRARIEPLPDPSGSAVLLTLTDLTAVKRTEQMRADFVANASHELRTPLSTLIGFIETLQGPAADDVAAQRRFLAIMQQQAGRMARLVDDLLSLSRIELNEHLPPTAHAPVASVLRTVMQALELKAAARGMRLDLAFEGDLPDVIGDTEELAQVFQNLIDNAIKYSRVDTPITVSVAPSIKLRPGLAIGVRDHGDGISRQHLPRLTERFYRVDTARSREMGGTGLGLAIVKHIINRHRGLLEIESEIGEGSTFTIHLRIAQPLRLPEMDSAAPRSGAAG